MALQEVLTRYGFEFDKGKFAAIERGVKRNVKNLSASARHIDAFQQRMGGFLTRAKGVIGTYLGFRVIKGITSDYANAADEVAKFSKGLGVNAQEYQRLTHAAQLNGISIQELQVTLPNLGKRMGDAADGSKALALAFNRAGVSLDKKKLQDPISALKQLADGFKSGKLEGRRAQVLMTLFGRAGKKMGNLLDQGSEGITKLMAEADKLGIVLSQKQLKAAEDYNDEMLRVKSIMIGIRNTIAGRVLPVITKQLKAFQMWWREGRNAERAMRALKVVAFFTSLVIARIVTAAVIKQITLFVRGIWAGVQALRAMGVAGAFATAKLTLLLLLFAGIVLIIDDLVAFAQGRDSVIGRLLGDSKLAKTLRDALINLAREAKKAWEEIGPALADAWEEVKPALSDLKREIGPLIGPAIKFAVQTLIVVIKGLALAVKGLSKAMTFMIKVFKDIPKFAVGVLAVFSAIMKSIMGIENASNSALRAMQKLTGQTVKVNKAGVGALVKQIDRQLAPVTDSTGGQVTRGLFRPALAGTFAGGGASTTTANVAAGAVTVNVSGAGDPVAVAKQVGAITQRAIGGIFTDASRNLKKPPRGQQ